MEPRQLQQQEQPHLQVLQDLIYWMYLLKEASHPTATTASPVGTSGNSNSNSIEIVGIVIGVFLGGVVLAVLVVAYLLVRKKRTAKLDQLDKGTSTLSFELNGTKSNNSSAISVATAPTLESEERIKEITNVEVKKKLGSGKLKAYEIWMFRKFWWCISWIMEWHFSCSQKIERQWRCNRIQKRSKNTFVRTHSMLTLTSFVAFSKVIHPNCVQFLVNTCMWEKHWHMDVGNVHITWRRSIYCNWISSKGITSWYHSITESTIDNNGPTLHVRSLVSIVIMQLIGQLEQSKDFHVWKQKKFFIEILHWEIYLLQS